MLALTTVRPAPHAESRTRAFALETAEVVAEAAGGVLH